MWLVVSMALAQEPMTESAHTPETPRSSEPETDTRALYLEHCQTCHGKNGRATFPGIMMSAGSFTAKGFWKGRPDARLRETVVKGGEAMGLKKAMPAFGDRLTDAEIDALMDYILAWRPE
jgi:mono/diheme cytochrome c family protein